MCTGAEPSQARAHGNEQIVEHALGEVRTFIDEIKNGTRKYKTIASLGGQIAEAYRGRCVLELLQNAHDALADAPGDQSGLITFSLQTAPAPVLLIANSGHAFERRDFKGICQLAQSAKNPNRSVGNKGLGFRSVLEVTSAPEIWSTKPAEGNAAFVFRFDPSIRDKVAAAMDALDDDGLAARSPFDPSVPLVDWNEDQLARYRERPSVGEQVGRSGEARRFLSPYDIPLPIEEQCAAVDDLLRAGHVTVIRLPLDGGRGGSVQEATASIKTQLEGLLDLATTLFLPHLKRLVVEIDGERTEVTRTVNADGALDRSGRSRRRTVSVSRAGPTQAEDVTGRFRVWTRSLGGASDPEWAQRIRRAVRHLPNKWPAVDRAEVGVAVREGPQPDEGRFVIFLPTAMATGTGAHINAPFFGSLNRRRIDFGDEYNVLLLECVTELCLDAVDDLLAGEPEDVRGQGAVDILGAWGEVEGTGRSMLERARERAGACNKALEERALVLCDGGRRTSAWRSAAEARAMPDVPDGLAIGAGDWRRAAMFSVVSRALDGRESGVRALVEGLGGLLKPTEAEWSQTVESAARQVESGEISATWDDFLTSLLDVLPPGLIREPRAGTDDALKTARFIPDQDGRLFSASDEARVFFQPVRGTADAAELVGTVPVPLKSRIAFLHGDVRTHEHEGPKRRRTAVHKFLDGRFVRGFRREEIVREVVLEAVPQLPAAFGSDDANLCKELLGWTIRLLGEEPAEALLSLLGRLPVACHGGWHRAAEAVFGKGWPESSGDSLWELADELGGPVEQGLLRTALLPPEDSRWGPDAVEPHQGLFARIGVADGLRLKPVDPVRFWMKKSHWELPYEAPAEIDQEAWDGWRAAARQEAIPEYLSSFKYSLDGVYRLPELQGAETLTSAGRRALSRLVLNSMRCWPLGWEQATVRKVHGDPSTWRITSPLKHRLSTVPWLRDDASGARPLSERWWVPISLLRGQRERFRHLRPLTLNLARRLEADSELADTLKELGLNVYPTDGERIGPELLNALAAAWRAQPEPAARFNVFLGQVRHAWQHFNESGEQLPTSFLVQTAPRQIEVLDREDERSLHNVYLPDHTENARSLRESKKPVLAIWVHEANSLADLLVEATGFRRASALEERVLIDGTEWMEVSKELPRLEDLGDTRFRWLPALLLTIAAHGGPNPTGAATKGWIDSRNRLHGARVMECESIVVSLADAESIARNEPSAWWLPGDVLAVTRKVGSAYEKLAPAAQAMLDRRDLLKDLRLVLGAVEGAEAPSREQIESALERAEIDAHAFADVQSRWDGSTGLLATRVRPVAELLGLDGSEFEKAAKNAGDLTLWLKENIKEWEPQWSAEKLVSAARRSLDDHEMGLKAWRALGDAAQLPKWNAVLQRLEGEYKSVENKLVDEQTEAHLESLRPLMQAVSRHVAIKADEPELFLKYREGTSEFKVPDDWSRKWWEVPFTAVLEALRNRCEQAVPESGAFLQVAASVGELRKDLKKREVEIDVDPDKTARNNEYQFKKMLLHLHDLHCTWAWKQESGVPDQPRSSDLGAEAFLDELSEEDLWRRAWEILKLKDKEFDKKFIEACRKSASPRGVMKQLGLTEQDVKDTRNERKQQGRRRRREKLVIAGESFEVATLDYVELRQEHINRLGQPTGPRAKDDEYPPLRRPRDFKRGNGKGGQGSIPPKVRRPSPEVAQVIGVVGEMHAYRFLRKEFGGRSVQARAWVSETRLKVLPPVKGEQDKTSDGYGFDFRFGHHGIQWRVEVKATSGNEPSFELGITEIQAATAIAKRRSDKLRWRILRVRKALSKQPEFDWLPNPFEEGFRDYFRLHRGGMFVSYRTRRE